jgi:hypothetical protein
MKFFQNPNMKNLYLAIAVSIASIHLNAQVGIGTTTPTSTLDVRGSFSAGYRTVTGSVTLGSSDFSVSFTGTTAATITLPDAAVCSGRTYVIKNASATLPTPVLTIATSSSQVIDASSGWTLDEPNELISVISNGTKWYIENQAVPMPKSSTTGGAWNQGGNRSTAAKAFGTITNYDLPFLTNNTERMRISNVGNIGIGTSSFDATYPEKLVIDAGTTSSVNALYLRGTINNYFQVNIHNLSSGNQSSSDLVATANNGTETTNFIDLGINGSGYSYQSGNPIETGKANDGYLISSGNDFYVVNNNVSKDVIFLTGGTSPSNEAMRITSAEKVGIATTTPLAKLDVAGTFKLGASGTVLNNMIKGSVNVVDNTTFAYQATREITVTVTGAALNGSVIVNPRTSLPSGISIGWVRVSAANTVIIGFTNTDTTPRAVGTVTFDITVIE